MPVSASRNQHSIPPGTSQASETVSSPFSRRAFLAGAGGIGAASLLGGLEAGTLGASGADAAPATVRWANWSLYLDYDNKTKQYPTLQAFTKKTGIPAKYYEVIDDNDSFTAKVQPQLRIKKDIGYDEVVMTAWMAARWIASGYSAKFDAGKVPNKKNILPSLANPTFDPGRQYSLPWAGVIAGLAWNKKKNPKGIHTIDQLFSKANKGKIEVLSEMRDTVGLVMLWQGVDISKPFTEDKFMNAIDYITKMIHDGYIRQIKGQSYQEDLISGDAAAVIGWSGDINQLNLQNQNQFGFAIPESGSTFTTDNMMIPITSPNKAGAEALINYYYDPVVAAKVANYITYVCPVNGAREAMAKINPKQVDNPLIFPDDKMVKQLFTFRNLTPAEQIKFSTAFQKASGNG
jgi:spermidine/putrescine transport system substrate-binding protein